MYFQRDYLFISYTSFFVCTFLQIFLKIIFLYQFVKKFADFLTIFSCINLCRILQNSWWLFVVSNLWTILQILKITASCINLCTTLQNSLWVILQTFLKIACCINLCKLSCRIFKKKILFVVSICEQFCKILDHFLLHQYLCASLHNFCFNGLETIQCKRVIILSCTLEMQVQQWVSAGLTWLIPMHIRNANCKMVFPFSALWRLFFPTSPKDKTKYANFVKYTQLNNQSNKELWHLFTCMRENSAWNSNFIWLCALSSHLKETMVRKLSDRCWSKLLKLWYTHRTRLMHMFYALAEPNWCTNFWSAVISEALLQIQEGMYQVTFISHLQYPAWKHSYYTRKTDKFWHLLNILLVPCCPSGFSRHQTCPEGCQKRLPVQILACSKTKTYISTQNRSLQIL
jgi:hypothetical protein